MFFFYIYKNIYLREETPLARLIQFLYKKEPPENSSLPGNYHVCTVFVSEINIRVF